MRAGVYDFRSVSFKRAFAFKRVFKDLNQYLVPGKVLCLGARSGCEIIGARSAGFFGSTGIDLFPGNDLVIKGDWHDIPFTSSSFENVFTNSIDHCLNLPKMLSEIKRVLIPQGMFLLLAAYREEWSKISIESRMEKSLEALFWDHPDDLIPEFTKFGFELVKSGTIKSHYYLLRNGGQNES